MQTKNGFRVGRLRRIGRLLLFLWAFGMVIVGMRFGAGRLFAAPPHQEEPTPTLDPVFFTPTPTLDPFFYTPTPDPFLEPPTPDPFATPTIDPFLQQPDMQQPDSPLPPEGEGAPPLPDSSGVLTSSVPAEEPPPPPPGFAVTREQALNATVAVPSVAASGAVQLVDGRFDNPETGLSIVVSDTIVALGDLDGDTYDDAALIVNTYQGGVRQSTDLVVLTAQGDVVGVAAGLPLGGSVTVKDMRIDRGAVWADLRVLGPTDAPCCPTLPIKRIYVLRGDQILELPAASYGRLFPYRYGTRYGYVNVLGEFVVPPQFVFAGDYVEGLALVSSDGIQYGFIDRLGQKVIPEQYQFATPFDGGMAVAGLAPAAPGEGARAIFIDRSGANLFGEQSFSTAQPFSEGMAAVKSDEGRFGFIDRTGTMVIPASFDFALPFSEGLAPVVVGDKVGYVDRRGVTVIDPQFDAGDSFSEGLAAVAISGTVGYIDHAGNFVIEPQFERAERFVDGLALAVRDGKELFVDLKGANAFAENDYEAAQRFSEGRAAARKDGLFGYLDPAGAMAIPPQFEVAGPFDNGLAVVENAGRWGVVDFDGTWLVQLTLLPRAGTVTGTIPSAAALSAPGTQTVTFVPAVPDEIRAGSCYTGSDIVPLPTAWRCGVAGGEVFDPCVLAADGATVVCNMDPTTDQPGFALELAQPLPAAGVEGKVRPGAWLFQLESGETCRYNMGATVAVGDEKIIYSCSNLTQLIGDIDKTTPTWTIDAVTTESDGQGGLEVTSRTPVTIVRIWLPGVLPAKP